MALRPAPFSSLPHGLAHRLACFLAIIMAVFSATPAVLEAAVASKTPFADTLELPILEGRLLPPPPAAAKQVLIPSDVDRQLGNLADLLERMAGLHVVRTGQLGDYLGVSIHGSSERQVNVYVNGVLKNPGADPSLFLGDWDLSRVERIEVYKGLAPDHLSGSPMGGAINIITREGGSGSGARAALGSGSFGSLRINGGVDAAQSGWNLHAQAARDQSDGNFTYYDDNGAEFRPGRYPDGAPRLGAEDLTRKTRRNNGHAFSELDGALAYLPTPNSEVGIQTDFSRLDKEIPSPYANLDSTLDINTHRGSDRFMGRGYGRFSSARLEITGDLSAAYQGDAYVDTACSLGIACNNETDEYDDALASVTMRATVTDGLTVSAMVSYGISRYLFTDLLEDRTYPRLYRYTGDGKFTPTYTRGRHTLQAILGATVYRQEHDGRTGYAYGGISIPSQYQGQHQSLRLGYQYRPRDGLWLSAQAGNAYRIPIFMEQFGDRGTVRGSPSLRSEAGKNASLTAHAAVPKASAEIQAFLSEGSRIITLVQVSQNTLIYSNSGDTRVAGLDLRGTLTPRPWNRTELDLTFQKAENLAGGGQVDDYKLIAYRPLTQASLRQTFLWGRWTASAYAYYQGLAYPNPSNQPSLFDAYSHNTDWQSRCDLALSWRTRHFMAAGSARNVFNSRNFDFFNFPLPGRSYSASLQIEL